MAKRILLLADINSIHTGKLVCGIADAGFQVAVFSLSSLKHGNDFFVKHNIEIFDAGLDSGIFNSSSLKKIAYLKQVRALNRVIANFKPDIVHAHYATSYGLLGKLSGFHPLIISSWGSDVLDFPGNSVKRLLLRKILLSADLLMATSVTLQLAVKRISGSEAMLTPFGVDTVLFCPGEKSTHFPEETIVFGTVKSLERVYAIDILIEAYAEVKKRTGKKTGLLIVGDGQKKEELLQLVSELKLEKEVKFTGRIPHKEVVPILNEISIFLNISRFESFGVSVLEAMACEKPVIVTDTGGLAEIVADGIDGLKVPVEDVFATADAMMKFLNDAAMRESFGKSGRKKVIEQFDFSKTIEMMSAAYQTILEAKK